MKKIVALLSAALILVSFSSCKGNGDKDSSMVLSGDRNGTNIMPQVSQGKIPEVQFGLGSDPQEILAGDETYLQEYDGYKGISTETAAYYYENGKDADGISAIVTYFEAYGMQVGAFTTPDDIISNNTDIEWDRHKPEESEMFFSPFIPDDAEVLVATSGNYKLSIFFTENDIMAISLTDTAKWTL